MSVEISAVKTSEPHRDGPARWVQLIPHLVLLLVVAIVVTVSSLTPDSVVEIPISCRPALSESDGLELFGGFWVVEEMWLGSQLEFSEQHEMSKWDKASDRWNQGERPVSYQESNRIVRITPDHTFEITSELCDVADMVLTCRCRLTEMVYLTRFDPEGMGTVNAVPIAWDEEKEVVLKKLDAGESLRGLYSLNGKKMSIYLPGDSHGLRPREIPEVLSPTDRLFLLRRASDSESENVYYPVTWAESYYGKTDKINSDGTVNVLLDDGNPMGPQLEKIPVPLTTPIEKAVDPPRTEGTFTFCHTNGWIVQTVPPPEPEPVPKVKPHPALQWLRNQAEKLK